MEKFQSWFLRRLLNLRNFKERKIARYVEEEKVGEKVAKTALMATRDSVDATKAGKNSTSSGEMALPPLSSRLQGSCLIYLCIFKGRQPGTKQIFSGFVIYNHVLFLSRQSVALGLEQTVHGQSSQQLCNVTVCSYC